MYKQLNHMEQTPDMNSQNSAPHRIENPRNHSDESMAKLRSLLSADAPLREDPRRPDFFELDDNDRVFYIYVSPSTGTITLLATWVRELEPEPVAG